MHLFVVFSNVFNNILMTFRRKEWLAKVGSKKSQITKCDFHNESSISSYSFTAFEIIRDDEKKLKKKKLKPRLSHP